MRAILLLAILAIGAFFLYDRFQRGEGAAPDVIENPMYAEFRMDMKVASREIDLVLFGLMASDEDCRKRADRVWDKVIEGCKECTIKVMECKADIGARYERLFDDNPIHSTYLSFKRGSPFERDGRMVIFGLTSDEGDALCEQTRARFQSQYSGKVTCVIGRRD